MNFFTAVGILDSRLCNIFLHHGKKQVSLPFSDTSVLIGPRATFNHYFVALFKHFGWSKKIEPDAPVWIREVGSALADLEAAATTPEQQIAVGKFLASERWLSSIHIASTKRVIEVEYDEPGSIYTAAYSASMRVDVRNCELELMPYCETWLAPLRELKAKEHDCNISFRENVVVIKNEPISVPENSFLFFRAVYDAKGHRITQQEIRQKPGCGHLPEKLASVFKKLPPVLQEYIRCSRQGYLFCPPQPRQEDNPKRPT